MANVWSTAPLFYGRGAKADQDMDAETFLNRMTKITNNAHVGNVVPNDLQRIDGVVSNFRGEADIWWNHGLPNSEPDDYEVFSTNWTRFKTRFRQEYFPFFRRSDASINWVAFKQVAGESAYMFLMRVNNAATLFSGLIKTPGDEDAPEEITVPAVAALVNAHRGPVRVALDALNDAQKQDLANVMTTEKVAFRKEYADTYKMCLVLKVVINGVQDNRLKPLLNKCAKEDIPMHEVMLRLRTLEMEHGNRTGSSKHIHGMEGENTQTQAELDAIKKKEKADRDRNSRGGRGRGRGGGRGRGRGGNRDTNSAPNSSSETNEQHPPCGFCAKTNHSIENCFQRNAIIKRKQEQQSGRDSAVAAAGASSDKPPTYDAAAEALNKLLAF